MGPSQTTLQGTGAYLCTTPLVSKSPLGSPARTTWDGVVLRSKVDCLRICEQGPVAVVYPEGVWYRGVTPEVLDMIIDQHLIGGRIVEEYAFARGALGR